MSNDKRIVLITGANGGIGRVLVSTFSEAGYNVIATDRQAAADGLSCDHFVQADVEQTVADEAYAETVFADIRQHCVGGRLNGLVNNAAVQILASSADLSRVDWRTTLNTNLLAPFFWTQALLPELQRAGGSVVNISSIHAQQTKQQFVAYATSKAALSAMTRNMAVDLGGEVRVNAIEPAAVRTEMLVEGFAGNEEGLAELGRFHPLGRIAEPREIAKIAVFLCSPDASFLQGSIVSATGGILGRLSDPA